MKRLYLLILFFLLPSVLTTAQDTTETPGAGWQIEQRCVGKPTPPPKGWTYDGTILMTGYAGIHAVQADWDVPHIISKGGTAPGGGILSPDRRWYAVLQGTVDYSQGAGMMRASTSITQIRVYSMVTTDESYAMDWENDYTIAGMFAEWHQMYWFDNEHLVYELGGSYFLINPFQGTYERWKGQIEPSLLSLRVSPDWTRGIFYTEQSWAMTDGKLTRNLPLRTHDNPNHFRGAWSPDSSRFVGEIFLENISPSEQIALFDRDGNLFDVIFSADADEEMNFTDGEWSHNNRFLATKTEYRTNGNGYHLKFSLFDIQTHTIIDTCLSVRDGFAWSPDNTQLAFIAFGEGRQSVRILDLNAWKMYTVAYHDGSIIGWRAND